MTVTLLTLLLVPVATATGSGSSAKREICQAFGKWCHQAIRVSSCETGGTFSVYARNGRYWGLFQVSDHWRRTIPGWGWTPRAQARHAYRVFAATGYSWRHWSCQP